LNKDIPKPNDRYKTFDDTSSVETIKFHSNSRELIVPKSQAPLKINLKANLTSVRFRYSLRFY